MPDKCDVVCRHHPEFALRVREIGGFTLDNVPRATVLASPHLPTIVPMLFHGGSRVRPFEVPMAALSLYRMFHRRNGLPRFLSAADLRGAYRLGPTTSLMLTGTADDPPLERWWSLGEAARRALIRNMRAVGIAFATTPNYSLFIDQPRWDDLHAMKRIGIIHAEFLASGMPCGLHVNARTETDFRRWATYIQERPEVTDIAFEFTTGTGWGDRQDVHAAWLIELARAAGRPLGLIVRGGVEVLPSLAANFMRVTFIDTSIFMKTLNRQRATVVSGAMKWHPSPTAINAPVDILMSDNFRTVEAWFTQTQSLGHRRKRATNE